MRLPIALLLLAAALRPHRLAAANVYVPLAVDETAGVARASVPVTAGLPLPRGRVAATDNLRLVDAATGVALPVQLEPLATWPDGSLRWLLADFQTSLAANSSTRLALTFDPYTPAPPPPKSVTVTSTAAAFTVDTGAAVFVVPRAGFRGFASVRVGATDLLAAPGTDLWLDAGAAGVFQSSRDASSVVTLEEPGPLRAVLRAEGTFRDGAGTPFLAYVARVHFYAGATYVRFFLTLRNGAAAVHPNNVWDLGSSGSRYVEDLSLVVPTTLAGALTATAWGEPAAPTTTPLASAVTLYQESSGGARWNWNTHVDRFNVMPLTFRGYELRAGAATIAAGNRARGVLDLSSAQAGVAVSVRHFWQNFPKAVRATPPTTVSIGLFPTEFPEPHEIQGGEEKTHEVLLDFHAGDAATAGVDATLADLAAPLHARPEYTEVARTQALGTFGPRDLAAFPNWENTVEYIAYDKGDRSFFTQRESIDEYGWRNFGEAMADHETDCGTQCWDCPISHDNNQYDYDWASLLFWIRNGGPAWLDLGEQGVRHLMDVDVYHTDLDTPAYDHGLFWHTTHDTNALTATHRTYSALMALRSPPCTQYLSGGPAPGHLYTEGLLLYGYLTGDRRAFEVHAELEGYLRTRYALDAPGPGSGYETRAWANALRTAVAGYRRTGDPALYAFAVQVVSDSRASANPAVDGTVFGDSMVMVALGRFLDLKADQGKLADADAAAALASLETYAARVRANYPPKQDVLDFRYSEALWYAYKYAAQADPDKASWAALGKSFFETGERTGFFNAYITCKGLAHTATNGQLHTYFERGRIADAATRLLAVKAPTRADVQLTWTPPTTDVHGNPIALGPFRVHRSVARPTRYTDVPLATPAPPAYTAAGDVTDPRPLFFYEVHAKAEPGIEGY